MQDRARRFINRPASSRKSAKHAARVGYELMVSAWPEPPNAKSAATSAGVRHTVKVFASTTTETLPNRAGEERSGVQTALNESFERAFLRGIGLAFVAVGFAHSTRLGVARLCA